MTPTIMYAMARDVKGVDTVVTDPDTSIVVAAVLHWKTGGRVVRAVAIRNQRIFREDDFSALKYIIARLPLDEAE